jgi:ribosomal protein S18 acetylase RimI-like enzyme
VGLVARRKPRARHILSTDPAGSFVATINGLVVGFTQGFVRGDIWFLAQLFVHPEVHARGIGRTLLKLALDYGREAGCGIFSVVSSTSPVAQSLYMRSGMFAFGIGYRIAGPVEALLDLPEADGAKKLVVNCSGWQDRIAELDRELLALIGARTTLSTSTLPAGRPTMLRSP